MLMKEIINSINTEVKDRKKRISIKRTDKKKILVSIIEIIKKSFSDI